MRGHTTWRIELTGELEAHGESWDDVEASTLTDEDLDRKFYSGFGGEEGCHFTVWTTNSVYFPWCYDGAEGVARVSRHPDGKATPHVGG